MTSNKPNKPNRPYRESAFILTRKEIQNEKLEKIRQKYLLGVPKEEIIQFAENDLELKKLLDDI